MSCAKIQGAGKLTPYSGRKDYRGWVFGGILLAMAACGGGGGGGGAPSTALTTTVMGGTSPISSSAVTLYEASTTSGGTPTLLAKGTTDNKGDVTFYYSPPPAGSVLYVTASGGVTGGAQNNTYISLLGVLGLTGSSSLPSSVVLNETTTAAAVTAFGASFGSNGVISGGLSALSNAYKTLGTLIDVQKGTILTTGTTATTIQNNANYLAACVQDSGNCQNEASDLSVPSKEIATGTLAIMYEIQNTPTLSNTESTDLKNMVSALSSPPYPTSSSTSSSAPSVSSVNATITTYCSSGCTHTVTGLDGLSNLALGGNDSVYVTNCYYGSSCTGSIAELASGTTTISLLQPGGTLTFNNPAYDAVDASGNVWISNFSGGDVTEINSSGSSVINAVSNVGTQPMGIAVDGSGNIWVANYGGGSVAEISSAGSILHTFSGGSYGFDGPQGIAVDSSNNIWVTNSQSSHVTEMSSSGTFIRTITVGLNPIGIAADASGNIWVANSGGTTVTEISSSGTVLHTISGFHGPHGIAVDGSGNVWVVNDNATGSNVAGVTEILAGTTSIKNYMGNFTTPFGVAVDHSGNVWVASSASPSTLLELIGVAAATTVPIVDQTR